jgi:RNA polymerase sigma factor (sigma-70 family)
MHDGHDTVAVGAITLPRCDIAQKRRTYRMPSIHRGEPAFGVAGREHCACLRALGEFAEPIDGVAALRRTVASEACRRILLATLHGHGEPAEDLLAEIVARLLDPRIARRYDPARSHPVQFALGVARYVISEARRRAQRRQRVGSLDAEPLDRGTNPHDSASRADQWRAVEAELELLPRRDRELICSRYGVCGSLRDERIAPGRERSQLSRVLRRLRDRLVDE